MITRLQLNALRRIARQLSDASKAFESLCVPSSGGNLIHADERHDLSDARNTVDCMIADAENESAK